MSELIRREDCRIPSNKLVELAHMYEITDKSNQMPINLFEFVSAIINAATHNAPTITTDEVIAYKCPECKTVNILYNPKKEQFCPTCGIERRN